MFKDMQKTKAMWHLVLVPDDLMQACMSQEERRGRPAKAPKVKHWAKHDVKALEDRLMCLGDTHPSDLGAEVS